MRSTSKPPTLGSITSRMRISKSFDSSCAQRIAAVVHAPDLEMFSAQILGEHLAQLPIVIDDQNAASRDGPPSSAEEFDALVIS